MKTGDVTFRDLIDLEYCLLQDRDCDQAALHQRDREIYLNSFDNGEDIAASNLLSTWLDKRRRTLLEGQQNKLPGTLIDEALDLLTIALLLGGCLVGAIIGFSFFSYSGTTPINVLLFLSIFVLPQLLSLVILALSALMRLLGLRQVPSVVTRIYSWLCRAFTSRYVDRFAKSLPAEQRFHLQQIKGIVQKGGAFYGRALSWSLFSVSQLTMAAFNGGLLAATLFRVATSDVAFGWQSTIQFGSVFIYRLVSYLAWPWSWLVSEQFAHPTLEQVEGSRIILKEGIYHLANQDLSSWWPFLVFCLLVYGLLLRLALFMAGRLGQKAALAGLDRNHPQITRLIQRMRTPVVKSQSRTPAAATSQAAAALDTSATLPGTESLHEPILLLIQGDIVATTPPATLKSYLAGQGFPIAHHEIVMQDYDRDLVILKKLSEEKENHGQGVLLIIEAWMPPIGDSLTFLRQLREAIGPRQPLFVGLAGSPQESGLFTSPLPEHSKVWHQKLDALADPALTVMELGAQSSR